MKFVKIIGAGALTICTATPAVAAHPPLDRPTPPPCCADGICRPNAAEWGWYRTQWRRWPTEELAPTPATSPGKAGKEAVPGVPSYETIPPELEDRRAPPPTKPRAESEERREAPPEGPSAPGGEPAAPRSAPLSSPPGGLLTTPPESPLTPGPTPFSPPATPFSPGPS